jgi:hypothetical protein
MTQAPSIPTPTVPVYFDYIASARAALLSDAELLAVIHVLEADYPHDLMLRELHILRVCNAISRGTTTIRHVLDTAGSQAA